MKLQNYSEEFMTETQNGFRKGRSCTDPPFCLKLLIEKRREFNLETHLLFIDYEKAFDNIQRQILFNILKSRHISDTLLKAIGDIYTQNKISIKFNNKLSKPVEINKGVRQGCPLPPTPFNPLKPELNPICYLLALLAHHFLHVSRIRVKSLTIRLLMSYIYGAPILDVSRSHTTTQHSR